MQYRYQGLNIIVEIDEFRVLIVDLALSTLLFAFLIENGYPENSAYGAVDGKY